MGTPLEWVHEFFRVWNTHDLAAMEALHAPSSTAFNERARTASPLPRTDCRSCLLCVQFRDWGASWGPTNKDAAKGCQAIWDEVPNVQIRVLTVFLCGKELSCVAHLKVMLGNEANTEVNVVNLFEFTEAGKVSSIVGYKAAPQDAGT
jgi:hypothetical protein